MTSREVATVQRHASRLITVISNLADEFSRRHAGHHAALVYLSR